MNENSKIKADDAARKTQEAAIDEAGRESFPASDPPAFTSSRVRTPSATSPQPKPKTP